MLRKAILVMAASFLAMSSAVAQEEAPADSLEGWTLGGNTNFNFTLVQLENWAGGGENSISLGSKLVYDADFKKNNSSWDNHLDIAYGQAKIGDDRLQKTDDQLIITSKYGYEFKNHWYFSASADFRTQLTNGFNEENVTDSTTEFFLISKFMAPGFLVTGLGLEYKPNKNFFVSIYPLSSKSTFVAYDDIEETAYGLEEGTSSRTEFGLSFKTGYTKKNIVKNVDFDTRLNLFGNYSRLEHIDVNWETTLNFKINDYLSANYSIIMVYDDDIDLVREDNTVGPALQLKQVLNLGINFKL